MGFWQSCSLLGHVLDSAVQSDLAQAWASARTWAFPKTSIVYSTEKYMLLSPSWLSSLSSGSHWHKFSESVTKNLKSIRQYWHCSLKYNGALKMQEIPFQRPKNTKIFQGRMPLAPLISVLPISGYHTFSGYVTGLIYPNVERHQRHASCHTSLKGVLVIKQIIIIIVNSSCVPVMWQKHQSVKKFYFNTENLKCW